MKCMKVMKENWERAAAGPTPAPSAPPPRADRSAAGGQVRHGRTSGELRQASPETGCHVASLIFLLAIGAPIGHTPAVQQPTAAGVQIA